MCVLYSEVHYNGDVQILNLDDEDDTFKFYPTPETGIPAPMATIGSFQCGSGVTLKLLRGDGEHSYSSG